MIFGIKGKEMTPKDRSQDTKDKISAGQKDTWRDPRKRIEQKKHIAARKAPVDEIDKLDYKLWKVNLNLFIEYFYIKQKTLCLREILNNLEKEILIEVLYRVKGNQRDAARFLDLKCSTLNEKIKKHNIKISKTKIQKINIEVN